MGENSVCSSSIYSGTVLAVKGNEDIGPVLRLFMVQWKSQANKQM